MSTPHIPQAKHVLMIDRVLEAPVGNVWRCWTEGPLMEQWFCPKPWFVSDVRLDLRPGGECFFFINGPDGERFDNPGVFLAVEPERRLVMTDAFLPGWIPSERAFMVADVTMTDAGDRKTHYIARALHWDEAAKLEHEKMGFHDGWGKAADQLEALARTL